MAKQKFSFSDLKIGDLVLTTNNKVGEVIALKSYAYLNDKISKKANKDKDKNNKKPFIVDNNRHNGVWYSAVTVMIEDENAETPTYYTEGLDFIEIREILNQKPTHFQSILNKIKNYLKDNNIHEC